MTTIRHGGRSGLRIGMRSDERGPKSGVFFMSLGAAWFLSHVQRGGVTKLYSDIYLIPLCLFKIIGRHRAEREKKRGTRATPPKKWGGM